MAKELQTRPARPAPIYTEFDALTNKILNGQELSEEEEATFDRLTATWAVIRNYVHVKARKIIQKQYKCSQSTAIKWMKRASDFFAEIETLNVQAERLRQKMRLEAMLDHPKTTLAQKIQVEKLLAEILGTKNHEKEAKDSRQRPLFILQQYTSDPQAFREAEREVDYEEA